ncbi:MAG: GntR family transcriptional regulator [Kiritimatiellae bacterium]|nr:GntR family transcriptional regulator [Kiritimatiellia bacterium]
MHSNTLSGAKAPYQLLCERMFDDFWVRRPTAVGAKLPVVMKLAQRYQVSCNTVVRAVSLLAADGWVTKRQGSGIYVAALSNTPRPRRRRSQGRIGFVVHSLAHTICHRVFEGVEQAANRVGCVVEVASTHWDMAKERAHLEAMRDRGVQGVVLYPGPRRRDATEYLCTELHDYPIVVTDLYQPTMQRPHVVVDNVSAGREMTRHLLARQRPRIVFLKTEDELLHRSVDDRVIGYRQAMEEAGLAPQIERMRLLEGRQGDLSCRSALDRMLAQPLPPDALIVFHDRYAQLSVAYLRSRGVRVPEQIAVAGFDDLQNAVLTEPLPSTRPDFVRVGELATEMLLERIQSRSREIASAVLTCPLVLHDGAPGVPAPPGVAVETSVV